MRRPFGRYSKPFWLAFALFASYAYFYQGGGWNQNVRFDLVRAITERHTLQIDVYQDNTGDKAEFAGHVYADKAPGASLTAVPAVALARTTLRVLGYDVYSLRSIEWLSYVSTVAGAALPALLAALGVYAVARQLLMTESAAAVAGLVCGLGTPLWAYATLLYGHALAAGCLVAALLFAQGLPTPALAARDERRRGFWIGLAAAWSVVTEFPAGPPAALIVLFACWRARPWPAVRQRRLWLGLACGVALGAVVLLGYNALAFGSPWHLGYASETAGYEGMHRGIFGVHWPEPRIAMLLLLGRYRGLLPLAPVLALAPVGLWMLMRAKPTRDVGIVATSIAVYFFLMTAGYAYWDGGWSYGSRHLGPALPFLALGLAPIWQQSGRRVRTLVLLLAMMSIGESLVAVSTTPQPPGLAADDPLREVLTPPRGNGAADPMRELLWPAFVSGDFPSGWQSVLELRAPAEAPSELQRRGIRRASWNLGQRLFHLDGHASLVPLLLIWVACYIGWRSALAGENERARACFAREQ
jgi:hypothetical protein